MAHTCTLTRHIHTHQNFDPFELDRDFRPLIPGELCCILASLDFTVFYLQVLSKEEIHSYAASIRHNGELVSGLNGLFEEHPEAEVNNDLCVYVCVCVCRFTAMRRPYVTMESWCPA